jgi:hypothetical protein
MQNNNFQSKNFLFVLINAIINGIITNFYRYLKFGYEKTVLYIQYIYILYI